MKKFMKAIAFVTVMCLALSTVAFAAGSAVLGDTDKVLNITVTGAGDDQVALVVVEAGADLSDPLYINQTGAVDGEAEFTAVLTNKAVDAVDVYVGYATYASANNAPEKIGENIALTNPVTEVTISNVNCTWDLYRDDSEGSTMEQSATGAKLTFDFVAPEGVSAEQMVWKITYAGENGNVVKYSEVYDITGYGIGSIIVNSSVTLGLSFLNGSIKDGIESVEIVDISAIFVFSNGDERTASNN